MTSKPCDKCRQNPATVKVVKLTQGTVQETWLCQDCAADQSPYTAKAPTPLPTKPLEQLLAGYLGIKLPMAEAAARPPELELECPHCGLPFETYRSSLLLGCSHCYEAFEQHLQSDLRKFHGQAMHKGRVPEDAPSAPQRLRNPDDLRRRLQEAVKVEDFELAARLRDELRALEAELSTASSSTPAPDQP